MLILTLITKYLKEVAIIFEAHARTRVKSILFLWEG